nr:hypothetical protein Iba_chr14aCG11620 [Ipomoea batatas]
MLLQLPRVELCVCLSKGKVCREKENDDLGAGDAHTDMHAIFFSQPLVSLDYAVLTLFSKSVKALSTYDMHVIDIILAIPRALMLAFASYKRTRSLFGIRICTSNSAATIPHHYYIYNIRNGYCKRYWPMTSSACGTVSNDQSNQESIYQIVVTHETHV